MKQLSYFIYSIFCTCVLLQKCIEQERNKLILQCRNAHVYSYIYNYTCVLRSSTCQLEDTKETQKSQGCKNAAEPKDKRKVYHY